MKRTFWLLLTVIAAFGVWFYSRSQMDELYAEISRLRRLEDKQVSETPQESAARKKLEEKA